MAELSTLGGVIKTAYEGEANTNAYTDAEKTKLAGIEEGAEVNAVTSVNGETGAVELSAADVGALPSSYSPPPAPVASVNGETGAVQLTAADVGALPDDYTPPAAPVQSVNGETGAVQLSAADVGALPDSYSPPQGAAVSDAADESDAVTQLNALLASLRAAGIIAT